ncbi:MAG: prepilin-type N-terminal cleavage/methylation domain-containing protein [Candidatus Dadabacteria bacterium]|nr:MAG: prepilin-type N-terminal cleavage/methylation domain-containing protein [Candidatus Dadabacteria bacterium]
MNYRNRRNKTLSKQLNEPRGFTLIELLLAISILVIVMAAAYASLTSLSRSKKLLDDTRESVAIADTVLQRITRELQLASPLPLLPPADQPKKKTLNTLQLLGTHQAHDNFSHDSITFVASEGGQYLPDGGTHTGEVQITYRVAEDPDHMDDLNPIYTLVRDEVPYTYPPEKAYNKIMTFPVTHRLVSLAFSYYDAENAQWHQEWGDQNSNTLRLPDLIEISITLRSPAGKNETFTTAVAIKSQK